MQREEEGHGTCLPLSCWMKKEEGLRARQEGKKRKESQDPPSHTYKIDGKNSVRLKEREVCGLGFEVMTG